MADVVREILLCLALAALLGFIIGWLARGLGRRRARVAEVEGRRAVEDLRGRVAVAESVRGSLEQALSEQRTLAESARREGEVLRRELREADQARDAIRATVTAAEERIADLSAQLSEMEAAGAAAKTEAAHARREAERSRAELASRTLGSEPTLQQMKTLRATLSAAESGWDSARAQAETALAQLAVAGRRISESESARTVLVGRLSQMDNLLAECTAEIAALRARVAELEAAPPLVAIPLPAPEPAPVRPAFAPDLRDDLQRIRGIGPVLERLLHRAGVYRYAQIAAWTPEDVQAMSERLPGFHRRIRRDRWTSAARRLHIQKYGAPPGSESASR